MVSNITSLKDYLNWVSITRRSNINILENDDFNIGNGLFNVYYRGQASVKWELTPGIFRDCFKKNYSAEHDLLKKASCILWKELEHLPTYLDKLTYLQHYGMATRLLDVTFNPLVALYFACLSYEVSDGVVYSGFKCETENRVGAEIVAEYVFSRAWTDIGASLINYSIEKNVQINEFLNPIFVYPSFNNPRLKSQKGAFVLCPLIKENPGGHVVPNREPLIDTPFFSSHKAVIPYKSKDSLLRELSILGVDEGNLYQSVSSRINTIIKEKKWEIERDDGLLFE